MKQAIDLGTLRAIEGRSRTIHKAVLQEKERVTFHEIQKPRLAMLGKVSVQADLPKPVPGRRFFFAFGKIATAYRDTR